MSGNITLRDYLKLQTSKLASTNVQEIKIKSEILVQNHLKLSKADLYLENIEISVKDIKVMDKMFSELSKNKPIQHIIGESYFYDNRFLTPPGVFIPRPETELLVDCAIDFLSKRKSSLTVVDFCSGSGCVLLSVAKKFPNHKYIGIDISDIAIDVAQKNSQFLDLKRVAKNLNSILSSRKLAPFLHKTLINLSKKDISEKFYCCVSRVIRLIAPQKQKSISFSQFSCSRPL